MTITNEPRDWRGIPLRDPEGVYDFEDGILKCWKVKREGFTFESDLCEYNDGTFCVDHRIIGLHPYYHSDQGPAIISRDGTLRWFRNGVEYTPTAHQLLTWEMRKMEAGQ